MNATGSTVKAAGRRTVRGEIAARIAVGSGADVALTASGLEPLTYSGLIDEIDKFARALADAGLPPNARIGVSVQEAPRAALGIVCAASSAIAVPFDPRLTAFETENRVDRLHLDAVCVAAGSDVPLRQVASERGIAMLEVSPDKPGSLAARYDWAVSPAVSSRVAEATPEIAVILPSSGTTADSKLIPYTHGNIVATIDRVKGWYSLSAADRCLCTSPVYYCHGLILTVLGPLLSGGSIAFPKNPSQPDPGEWLVELAPTWFSTAPAVHLALIEKMRAEAFAGPTALRFAVSGGAPLPSNIQVDMQALLGVPVLEHYGATEAGQIASNVPPPGPFKPGTCGVPDPEVVRIAIDPERGLPPGWGEVLVGGPSLTSGYLDADELNRLSFVDGWFHTGDLGSLDGEGFLQLHGRFKEIINRGGEKISPAEVDAALLRHPAILEAAAVAVPHPRLGEDVAAFAVLRPGTTVTVEELRKFLANQLAWFKIPRRITFVENLPRGNTGKIQRNRLVGELQ